MVINILINIKGFEDIECVAKIYAPGNGHITAEDQEEVRGTDDRVNMDHRHNSVSIVIDIGLDGPHPIVGIGPVK